MIRSVAHYRGDTRRTLKGRDPEWIRRYIGRLIVRLRTADDELEKIEVSRVLAPGVHRALSFLEDLAEGEE